jgi:hypothetical protein
MLFAAGAAWGERWVASLSRGSAITVRQTTWWSYATAGVICASMTLPLAPLNSSWWHNANISNGGMFDSQIGWQEYVETIAKVRDSLPPQDRATVAIMAGDEGEAGAVNLYGPAYGLPTAISLMNSNWERGYGNPPPRTVIVVGDVREFVDRNFSSCELAGHLTNHYGIKNSSVANWNEVFVCRQLREPWPQFWAHNRRYG